MGKIPVDDNHNEVLRKAAQDSDDATKYDLRAKVVNSSADSIPVNETHVNVIDTNNSTSTPLLASQTWQGTATEVLSYESFSIMVTSDVAGALDGIRIEMSPDGISWDDYHTFDYTGVWVGEARVFIHPIHSKYIRVSFLNGGTDQTYFNIQTILHTQPATQDIHRITDTIHGDEPVVIGKQVIVGESSAGGGSFVNVKVNPSGTLEVNANQGAHDDLNANANMQVNDIDVSQANPVPTEPLDNASTTGAITAATQSVQADCNGKGTAILNVSGTFVGTLMFQASLDGSTWVTHPGHVDGSITGSTQTTAPNTFIFRCTGFNFIRVYASSFTSGQADIFFSTTELTSTVSAWQFGTWLTRIQSSVGVNFLTDYGSSGNAIRAAAQVGNANGVADFNAGAPSAQTLRTVGALTDKTGALIDQANPLEVNSNLRVNNADVSESNPVYIDFQANHHDGFNFLRVTNPYTVFNNNFRNGVLPEFWTTSVTGTATIVTTEPPFAKLSTAAIGDVAKIRTRQYFKYIEGKSQMFKLTQAFVEQAGITCYTRVGDANNNITLRCVSGSYFLDLTNSIAGGITENIARANWDDPLDGNGISGVTWDFSKHHLLWIDYGWQGAAAIRVGVLTDDGVVYFHTFNKAQKTKPWAEYGDYPIEYYIEDVSSGTPATFYPVCVTCISEGGEAPSGLVQTLDNGVTAASLTTAWTPVFAVRLRSGKLTSNAVPVSYTVNPVSGNAYIQYSLEYNPTITGGTWNNFANILDTNTTATYSANGYVMDRDYVLAGSAGKSDVASRNVTTQIGMGSDYAGTADIVVLFARMVSGTGSALFTMKVRELL